MVKPSDGPAAESEPTLPGDMVVDVAHELNNALTGVLYFSQLAEIEAVDDEMREYIELVSREARRASSIVDNLLDCRHVQEDALGSVDLTELLERTLQVKEYNSGLSGIELKTSFEAGLPAVTGHIGQLQSLFLSLIIDA